MNTPDNFTDFKMQEKAIHEKEHTSISMLMDTKPVTAKSDDYIMKIGALMLARDIHRMPIVDNENKVIGVVSRGMVFRGLFRKELGLKK